MQKIFKFIKTEFYVEHLSGFYPGQFLAEPADMLFTGQLGVEIKNRLGNCGTKNSTKEAFGEGAKIEETFWHIYKI